MKKLRLIVLGKVQGVYYRVSTKQVADSLGLFGWVRNRRDGSVEIEAHGPAEKLDLFIAWAKKGPPMSRVDELIRYDALEEGYSDFTIKSTV